jgi:hypothetical protein
MVNPFSPLVLLGAAVISSPALWGAFVDGTIAVDAALTRYLVVVLITWACLSVVSSYAWSPTKPLAAKESSPGTKGATGTAPTQHDADRSEATHQAPPAA